MVKSSTWMSFGSAGFLVPSDAGPASNRSFDVVLANMNDGGFIARMPLASLVSDERVQKLAISCTPKLVPAEESAVQKWVANLKFGPAKKLARRVMLVGCRGKKTFVAALVAEMLVNAGRVQRAGDDLYGPSKCSINNTWSDLTLIRLAHLPSLAAPGSPSLQQISPTGKAAASSIASETTSAVLMQSHSSTGSINMGSSGANSQQQQAQATPSKDPSSAQKTTDGASNGQLSSARASQDVSQQSPKPLVPSSQSAPHDDQPQAPASPSAVKLVNVRPASAQKAEAEGTTRDNPAAPSGSSLDSLFAVLKRWSSPDPALNGSCPMPAAMTAH